MCCTCRSLQIPSNFHVLRSRGRVLEMPGLTGTLYTLVPDALNVAFPTDIARGPRMNWIFGTLQLST